MFSLNLKCAILQFVLITIANPMAAGLDTTWWKHTTIYEIYLSSFQDSNGDGVGDIKGLTQKMDHFVNLGIETLYLSPFCKSPMADFGYDISNYTEIDPSFGTMEDFYELIREMKHRGLKLIMDMVINHSSDEHPWFEKSIDRIDPYTDYYVWVDPKGFDQNGNPIPPNNWWSLFDGTAWEWNDKRKQFYLHQFAIKQPDFNLRNVQVVNEIKEILKFWLDRGVAGFRLDATRHYIEDKYLRDEPLKERKKTITTYTDLDHRYTADLWDCYELIHQLKSYVDQYKRREQTYERIFVAEAYTTMNLTMAYYGTKNYVITNFPFNFKFVNLVEYLNASAYNNGLQEWLKNIPEGATPNWMAENHDNIRIGSRFCEEYGDIVTMTIMTLPGVACIYYGQEIGLKNGFVRSDQRRDPNNNANGLDSFRDGERLPMQWDSTMNGGFSTKFKPWLPINPNYWKVNVEAQKIKEISRYNTFKALSKIRKRKTMKLGNFEPYIVSTWIYAFSRYLHHHERYITVLNLGTEIEPVHLHNIIPDLPPKLEVVAASMNAGYKIGDQILSLSLFPKIFLMRPLSAIVLSTRIHLTAPPRLAPQSTLKHSPEF